MAAPSAAAAAFNIFLGTVGYDQPVRQLPFPESPVTGAHAKVDRIDGSSDGATVSP